jgi:hypothetical protein
VNGEGLKAREIQSSDVLLPVAAGLGIARLFSEWRPLVLRLEMRFFPIYSLFYSLYRQVWSLLRASRGRPRLLSQFSLFFSFVLVSVRCLLVINFGPLLPHRPPLAAISLLLQSMSLLVTLGLTDITS